MERDHQHEATSKEIETLRAQMDEYQSVSNVLKNELDIHQERLKEKEETIRKLTSRMERLQEEVTDSKCLTFSVLH